MNRLLVRAFVSAIAVSVAYAPEAIVPNLPTANWPFAGKFGTDTLETSGVAIGDRWVLTARHAAFMADEDARFQMDGGPVHSSVRVYRHPTDDIAIVEFPDQFPGWYPIYTAGAEIGLIGEQVGYGATGEIIMGEYQYTGQAGIKRAGRNRITLAQFLNFGGIQGTFLISDFDGSGRDTFGDGGPVQDECTLGPGDSGGPTFVLDGGVWKVAGIHSWVGNVSGGPTPPRHGSIFGDLRVSTYASWINSIMPRRVVPTTFTVNTGVLQSGNTGSLAFSDNDYVRVREAPPLALGLPSVRVTIEGNSPLQNPSRLTARVEVATSAVPAGNVTFRAEMFNMVSSTWELVDTRAATSGDNMIVITPTGDPSRFVQSGTGIVRIRLSWFDPGTLFSFGWNSRIDMVIWEAYQ